jgi:Family of unknown function (DUF6932)
MDLELERLPDHFDPNLPRFSEEGLIPPGDYSPSETDFLSRFVARSDRRREIFAGWNRHREALLDAGLDAETRQLLNGSFTTDKAKPGDIDIAVEVPITWRLTVNRSERAEASLSEEIADLTNYLEGVPAELKTGGAFVGYEDRLRELQRAVARQRMEALTLPVDQLEELSTLPADAVQIWARTLLQAAARAEDNRRHEADVQYRLGKWLSAGTLVGAASATAAFLSAPVLGSVLAGGAAALAAALFGLDPFQRLRKGQETLARLIAFKSELNSFTTRHSQEAAAPTEVRELAERIQLIFAADEMRTTPAVLDR